MIKAVISLQNTPVFSYISLRIIVLKFSSSEKRGPLCYQCQWVGIWQLISEGGG